MTDAEDGKMLPVSDETLAALIEHHTRPDNERFNTVAALRELQSRRASSPAPEGEQHDWHERFGLTCCRKCGFVQRGDGGNKPCRGVVYVTLREDRSQAFDQAWSAMQHSEDNLVKKARRKLSIEDLRSLLNVFLGGIVSRPAPEEVERLRETLRIARMNAPLIRLAPERRYTIEVLDAALSSLPSEGRSEEKS